MADDTSQGPTWLDYGEAEFDARRLPKGHKPAPEGQPALFFMAVPPTEPKRKPAPEQLPGQDDLFGGTP